tara:strand:- start:7779 stop:8723 length:945 start_codon:yes stop_codon:yes gene_type:complete
MEHALEHTEKFENLPQIRQHWWTFMDNLRDWHINRGDEVLQVQGGLFEFTPKIAESIDCDLVYIPHKERPRFWVPGKHVLYFMQSVLPSRFYVDPMGFSAGHSTYPCDQFEFCQIDQDIVKSARDLITTNTSKFSQPDRKKINLPGKYVFFPCQIPHDETILFHSDVSVEIALSLTVQWCDKYDIPLVVKGHPVNPGSMASLKKLVSDKTIWIDDASIHQLIENSEFVVTVNSGTGFETILHNKPVVTFGRADYDCVSIQASPENYEFMFEYAMSPDALAFPELYDRFITWFVNECTVESTSLLSYEKITKHFS